MVRIVVNNGNLRTIEVFSEVVMVMVYLVSTPSRREETHITPKLVRELHKTRGALLELVNGIFREPNRPVLLETYKLAVPKPNSHILGRWLLTRLMLN